MRIPALFVLLAVVSLAGCQSSRAGKPKPDSVLLKAKQDFTVMDKDGNGRVLLDEALAGNAERFRSRDTNRDGYLSVTEYNATVAGTPTTASLKFADLDSDADGKLTLGESAIIVNSLFARFDKNGDNVLTAEEIRKPKPKARSRPKRGAGAGRKRR
ncbi:MAG: hypothetical protein MPJ78_19035 [Hyphomicrobiaceae bacterium]|nr:hypothetical protein [Hyphomicrobiaceae bacterium]